MTGAWTPSWRIESGGHVWSLKDALQSGRAQLNEIGVRTKLREPIALDAANRLSFVRAFLALRNLGAAVVPMPEGLDEAERRRRLAVADVRQELRTVPGRPEILVAPGGGRGSPLPTEYAVFTSGTEGPAKAALLSEEAFARHAQMCAQRIRSDADSRWLLSLSPAHVGGLALVTRSLVQGSTVVVPHERLPEDLDPILHGHRITHLSLVPLQLRRWLRARVMAPAPSTLRCVLIGGAACPPGLIIEARRAGIPAVATYGLTETGSQVATGTADSPPDTVGPALPGTELKIVDAEGAALDVGVDGRILVRSPSLFHGYLGNAAATASALRDGWFWTPDAGALDGHGNLRVGGRLGRIINTGGHKVDPARVEAALLSDGRVREAAVVARPDPEFGQRVVAIVVPGAPLDAEQVRAICRPHLAPHEVPKTVEFVPALPHSASGKIDLSRLA